MHKLSGLDEVAIVKTRAFDSLDKPTAFTIRHNDVMVVSGPLGVGKQTAVRSVLAEHSLPVTWLRPPPPRQTQQDLVRCLHAGVVGNDDLPERKLQDDLIDALRGDQRVVVVEDADRLTAEAAGQLEFLHAQPGATWSLVLIGNTGTAHAIARDHFLADAVGATVKVAPLAGKDLLDTLQGMHQMLLGADPELLLEINDKLCKGHLGAWARFLQKAIDLRDLAVGGGQDAPVLNRTFARAVIATMPRADAGRTK
jgi:DNA transposition AAA+ family ATPase